MRHLAAQASVVVYGLARQCAGPYRVRPPRDVPPSRGRLGCRATLGGADSQRLAEPSAADVIGRSFLSLLEWADFVCFA